ncbi:Mss4-like protein [Mycena alexandri]|uniref:Mss4-like protein n=1 Tax=Mycena alexandri TaxID=1745969 RepID=A0AAD6SIR5_9AGAR|nr:Mss4-like protein [Mycena alexandri]
MTSFAAADKSKPFIPLKAGGATDGWSNDDEATATCYCGAVQLKFATNPPGLIDTFSCNCYDCHKITASMFATNFTVADTHLTHIRGHEKLTVFTQSRTTGTGSTMANHFCSICGTLMYRVRGDSPGQSILRVGTVDDFSLHETKLKPRVENYVKDRVGWLHPVEGALQVQAFNIGPDAV